MLVKKLTGIELDYWVAKVEFPNSDVHKGDKLIPPYSIAWSAAGPVIEREEIQIVPRDEQEKWSAYKKNIEQWGETPLIAAMRVYCASKYGEEVDD